MSTNQVPNYPDEVVTTVRLSPEDHATFKEIAKREHRSLSGQVRFWIEQHIRADRQAA